MTQTKCKHYKKKILIQTILIYSTKGMLTVLTYSGMLKLIILISSTERMLMVMLTILIYSGTVWNTS